MISFSEDAELAGEVAAAGVEAAKALAVDAIALELDEVSSRLRSTGKVLLAKAEKDSLEADADSAASAIVEVARAKASRLLLVGETRFGTVVAAKVAARLKASSLGTGKGLRIEGGRVVVTRDVYGGKFLANVAAATPCVVVVQRGSYQANGGVVAGPAETMSVTARARKVVTVETRRSRKADVDIRSAPVVVAAGRGFAKKEDIALAQRLADALGAALGCSRPLSSDLGWMGEDQHIGLTGAYVHPRLYIAVGISGQLQHVAGIKDSKLIVAINRDGQAPIFQVADYGIVGDLYEILPALTKVLKGA